MEALDFWTQARSYPDTDIPTSKFYTAFKSSKTKLREVSNVLSAGSIWDPIGPLNLQGRTKCVAINPKNPSVIYVGTASGGLWKSKTSGLGADWEQVRLGYPVLGVSSIVIDPADTNIMYIGTGEVYRRNNSVGGLVQRTTRGSYGIGILKTTDGGLTWAKSLDWSYNQRRGVQMLKMNPMNPKTIWAATTEGAFKTVDGGESWSLVLGAQMVTDIVIHYSDSNKVMAAFGNFTNSTVVFTTNGGDNWLNSPLQSYTGKTLLAVYPKNSDIAYASAADSTSGVAGLYQSTNFGQNWNLMRSFPAGSMYGVQGWYSHYVAVHPEDSSIIVLNAVGRAKSTNSGIAITSVSSGYSDNHGYAIDPTNPNIFYAANDDGIYRSTNFGSSYTNIGFGIQSGQIYNGFSCSTTDSLIALSQSQDHIPGYRYLGSTTWDHASARDESGWTAITPGNDNIMYAVTRYGGSIYKSNDRGATFSYAGGFSAGSEGTAAWNSPVVVCPAQASVLYMGTKKIFKSTTAAGSWSATNGGSNLDGNPVLSLAVSATNPDTVYAGTAPISVTAHIFRTTNGGSTWTNVTDIIPDRYPIDIAVDPQNSSVAYVTMGGFGSGHVYKTTNTGTSWTDVTGTLPDVPTTAVVVDPFRSNVVYVGNDLGVYVSTDAGTTWSTFNAGLPDAVIVADLTISPSNRTLRVATHGNGVWERKMLFDIPVDFFDYKIASINYPSDGGQYFLGTSLTSFRVSVKNLSTLAQVDSFDVKYRILFGATEVYSSTKRIPGLGLAEQRSITFDGSYEPAVLGTYTSEAIVLSSDNNSSNDTLHSSFEIVAAPTIPYWTITKVYSPYQEIIPDNTGPTGDDAQASFALPFQFKFDQFLYDSIQLSTNGWAELGTGSSGSVRGLSSVSQLGGYFTPTLGTAQRPTKALGPWWADMIVNTPDQIGMKTIGSAPNRTFVIQWKNIEAYYANTSLLLNYQIRLHETTNIIEFCYGPKIDGSTDPGITGAYMGLKDHIGGDYRYFDLAKMGWGLSGDITSSLLPTTDWPGEDSSFQIITDVLEKTVSLLDGWNLVSLPVTRLDRSVQSIYPTVIHGTLFLYSSTYQLAGDTLLHGKGYWIKSSAAKDQIVRGVGFPTVEVELNSGWNLIGSVDHETPAPSGGIITSGVFTYNGSNYDQAATLLPGKGYWVKASSTGTITLGSTNIPRRAIQSIDPSCVITITNGLGKQQSLELMEQPEGGIDVSRYELPPLPPGEMFDVRFSSQRYREIYPKNFKEEISFPVQMQSPVYPLSVSIKSSSSTNTGFAIEQTENGKVVKRYPLTGGRVIIHDGDGKSLRIVVTTAREIPMIFALQQNYPNPFNPTTIINYQLPIDNWVTIKVYNIIGEEIATLVDEMQDAGYKSVTFDGSNLSSGIYFVRMNSSPSSSSGQAFADVKKIVLTK
ncbi:MAG: T9SS type A sorting domain-containing protein [Ignavibacteriales bacterium]|nr:T9SS type A sorting domain-containing protein [Ignavibacteriales bacterium]